MRKRAGAADWLHKTLASFPEPLSYDEERVLLFQSRSKNRSSGRAASEKLVNHNMRFGIAFIHGRGFARKPEELLENLSNIATGLMRAIRRYDHERTTKLITFARWFILSEVIEDFKCRILRQTVYIPTNILEAKQHVSTAIEELRQKHMTNLVDDDVVARHAKLSKKNVCEGRKLSRLSTIGISLESSLQELSDGSERVVGDMLAKSVSEDPLEKIYAEERRTALYCACRTVLAPRDLLIVHYRFFEGKTLKEIGTMLNISKEGVRQCEAKIKKKLRCALGYLEERTARDTEPVPLPKVIKTSWSE